MGLTLLPNSPFLWTGSDRDRPPCLLLHGLGAGVFEHALLGLFLYEQGYTVQAFNYPGHDQPGPRMPHSTWSEWYQAVEHHYHELYATYGRVAVVGFSTGGTLALHLAAHHPVSHLILLAPFLALKREPYLPFPVEVLVNSPLRYLLRSVPRLGSPVRDPAMQTLATASRPYQTFSVLSVRSALALIEVVRSELSQIQAPALIMQSWGDHVVEPSGAQAIFDALGSPRKHLQWLTGSDHILTLDHERDQVFAAILEFLTAEEDPNPSSANPSS